VTINEVWPLKAARRDVIANLKPFGNLGSGHHSLCGATLCD